MKLPSSILVLAMTLLSAGASARPGFAQTMADTMQSSVSVLLLPFESTKPGLGDALIVELSKRLDRTNGYAPISVQEAARRLPKVDFKPKLNCIHGRQLGHEIRAAFMVCGSIERLAPARYSIAVSIVHIMSQSSIVLHGIEARTIEDAAKEVARRITRFADEDVRRLIDMRDSMHVN